MAEFKFTARNAAGKEITGTLTANSRREVIALLRDRSLLAMNVAEQKAGFTLFKKRGGRVKAELLASTLTQLSDLLQNGVPLMKALDVLTAQAGNPVMTEVLSDVRKNVSEGIPLDQALARHPRVFDDLAVSMVRAGSEGAFLEDALKRTADFMELQEEMKGKVKGAMTYPVFLAVIGTLVVVGILVFLVPKFAELFAQLEKNGGLPGPTVLLLAMSAFLGSWKGILLGAVLFSLGMFAKNRLKSPEARLGVDQLKIKLPVAGQIFLNSAISRFCRVLGTLLRNGVPLLRALEISSDATGNLVLARAIRTSAENVSSGNTLSRPLSECGLLPRPVMAMITVAEESNNLENVLINIADGIDRKMGRQLEMMVRLLEPAMLMVMGAVVLFVLVALLLPVFEMSSTMT